MKGKFIEKNGELYPDAVAFVELHGGSEVAPSEPAGPSGSLRCDGVVGLRADGVDGLIEKWETHLALCVPGHADTAIRLITLFLADLRAEKARANQRQPEPNAADEARR